MNQKATKRNLGPIPGNNRFGRNFIKYAGVAAITIGCLLMSPTVPRAEEPLETSKVKALPGIPEDLEIVYGWGATHAERGRSIYSIRADGTVVYERTSGRRGSGNRQIEHFLLTKNELQSLMKAFEINNFFELNEQYTNPRIRDGSSAYLSVKFNGKQHSVTKINIKVKGFDRITDLIQNILKDKKPIQEKESLSP